MTTIEFGPGNNKTKHDILQVVERLQQLCICWI